MDVNMLIIVLTTPPKACRMFMVAARTRAPNSYNPAGDVHPQPDLRWTYGKNMYPLVI